MMKQGLIRSSLVWRSLQTDASPDFDDDNEAWTPLSRADYVHLGITIGYQVLVLLVVLHIWLCRTWPPYIPRQISLVCLTGIAGIVAYCGALIAYGVVERHRGQFLAQCGVEGLFDYYGWGLWTSVALVRVYRSWKILVRHSVDMWPAWGQVLFIATPYLLPMFAYTVKPSLAKFNERGNWCDINIAIDTILYIYGCVPIFGAFFLSYQMRKVRKQMNFFRMQILQLLFLLLTGTVAFPLLEEWLEGRDDIRRAWIMYDNVLTSLILFWPPIAEPLYHYIKGDKEYLHTYTKGFSTLPTPSQMRSSLKDQLSLEDLRKEFEKFADSKIARELPDFYKACLDREEIEDFFERQAATTAIIDRFIREGCEQEVNLSGEIRKKILATEITSYNIFNDAMAAVLKMMDNNFSAEFQETEAYKNLEKVVEEEAEELERLRRMRQLPPKNHVESDPKGLLKLIRRVSETVAIKSSKDGSSRQSEKTHSSSGLPRENSDEERLDLEDLCFDADGNIKRSLNDQEEGMVLSDDVGTVGGGVRIRRGLSNEVIADVYCLETRSSLGRHEHPYGDNNTKTNYEDPELSSESANETKRSSEDCRLLPPPNEHTRCDSRETLGRVSRTGVDALPPSYPREGNYAAPICAPSTVIISSAGAGQKSSPVGASSRSSIPSDLEAPRLIGDGRRLSSTGDGSGVFRSYRSHGSSSGSGLGGGGGGGGSSYLSPNPTGRWSEESRSVSWCSDNCLSPEHFGTSSSSNGGGGEDSSSPPIPPPPPPLPPPPPSERLCRRPQAPL